MERIPIFILLIVVMDSLWSMPEVPSFQRKLPTKVRKVNVTGLVGVVNVASHYPKVVKVVSNYLEPMNTTKIKFNRYKKGS